MSMEDAIHRLANAIGMAGEQSAVAEIIRQRDAALKDAAYQKSQKEMYDRWNDEKRQENARLGRVISALRGTITRMKRKRA